MPSEPASPPSPTTVNYHSAFVAELQAMDAKKALELVRQIKIAFQTDWEKRAIRPMNDKRAFSLPKVGGFTIVGYDDKEKKEVILLTARRT